MLAILPVSCFISIFLVLRKFQVLGWRGSFLFAALLWGLLLTAMTEILSLLRRLDFWSLIGAWGIVFLLVVPLLVFAYQKNGNLRINLHLFDLPRLELCLLVCMFFIIVVIGVTAWVAPPNTWDSMTYHMPRVMHWIQNKSVAFYPTSILRQLHQNPWSEFAILHFQILTGCDRFANFIQWFSMVGSIMGVSLLAKELKANMRGQLFAAVVCATIPMGVLQGSSTQTDYVVSFWLVCFVYFCILLKNKVSSLYALAAGAALGLAILTKATAYVFAFPFLAWLVLSSIKIRHAKKLCWIAFAIVIAFVINLGQYARNYDLYGNPLGPGEEGINLIYANEVFTFPAVTSNILRNIGLHLGTPIDYVNNSLSKVISICHRLIGFKLNDTRTTWGGLEFRVPKISFHEDAAGNLVHLCLIAASLILYGFQRSKERDATFYIFCIILAFVLFCAYLKWQPWNSRLHLPLFVLCAPFLGLVLSRIRYDRITNMFMMLLIMTALPWVFFNVSKPFFGRHSIFITSRNEQFFINRPALMYPYIESAHIFSETHCSEIGLIMGDLDFEYPLWVLLREGALGNVRIEHINVDNISHDEYFLDAFNPCAIFAVLADPVNAASKGNHFYSYCITGNYQLCAGSPNAISIGNTVYLQEWSSGPFVVFQRVSTP
jgi:4-amino-4-deoxy-L-arabinose transferase-like glycosyltransferase